jgi:hypothetical protein
MMLNYDSSRLNVVVEWLTLLLHSRNQISVRKLRFVFFLSNSRKIPEYCLKLGHGRFLPNPLQFVIHLSPSRWTVYSLSY